MPASFNKFNSLSSALDQKKMNLASDSLKIMLTNSAPVATNTQKSDLTDITAQNGYSAGGTALTGVSISSASGTDKLLANACTFTASGGPFGPFRYAVLYDDTATNKDLIGWWDYGSAITPASGETFTVNSAANGNWDTSNPLLTVVTS